MVDKQHVDDENGTKPLKHNRIDFSRTNIRIGSNNPRVKDTRYSRTKPHKIEFQWLWIKNSEKKYKRRKGKRESRDNTEGGWSTPSGPRTQNQSNQRR